MQPEPLDLAIAPEQLTDLVPKSLNQPVSEITGWEANQIHGGMEWDSAVYRVKGSAEAGGGNLPWSLILKIVRPSEKASDPEGIWYWKREGLAYQSGMLNQLPGGVVCAPTCYALREQPDGSLWLWLEDIQEDFEGHWKVGHLAAAAQHFGRFNGAYLAGEALPSGTWVTRNWLQKYVENAASMIEFVRENPQHPIIKNMYSPDIQALILGVWEAREGILNFLDQLPQVFCHQDAFKGNLFNRQGKTIVIDWGYAGIAPVGAELVALVLGSVGLFEMPVEGVDELDQRCFDGYLRGLREAGWPGDPKLARMGYCVTSLLRYPIGGSVGEALPRLLDQESRSKLETTFDRPAEDLEVIDPALTAYYLKLVPEAFQYLGM